MALLFKVFLDHNILALLSPIFDQLFKIKKTESACKNMYVSMNILQLQFQLKEQDTIVELVVISAKFYVLIKVLNPENEDNILSHILLSFYLEAPFFTS